MLIGGFSLDHGFLEDVWEYDLQLEIWKQFKMNGYGPAGKCFKTINFVLHILIYIKLYISFAFILIMFLLLAT